MEYLKRILGIQIKKERFDFVNVPNYINSRYKLEMVKLDGYKTIFLYPKTEIGELKSVNTHISRIKEEYKLPVVLILNQITYRKKEYLLKERIPFVADGKQIYLPFLGTYLQERCDAELNMGDKILPSTQLLILYFIYNGARDLSTSEAAKKLKLTPTSISRASKQLENLNILEIKKSGVNKILSFKGSPSDLFEEIKSILLSPVKKTVYIPKDTITDDLLKSNISALSEYTMINKPDIDYYATDSVSKWKDVYTNTLIDANTQSAVEVWRYNPRILTDTNMVDILSLTLSLDNDDERIEIAIDELLNKLWRKTVG